MFYVNETSSNYLFVLRANFGASPYVWMFGTGFVFCLYKEWKEVPIPLPFQHFSPLELPKEKTKKAFRQRNAKHQTSGQTKTNEKAKTQEVCRDREGTLHKTQKINVCSGFFLFEGCPTPPTPQVQSQERSIYLYIHAHVFKFTQPHIYTNIYIYIYRYAVVVSLCDSQTAVQSFSLWRRVDVWKDDNT